MQVKQGDSTLQRARAVRRILQRRVVMAGFLAATIILLVIGWQSHANAKRLAEASAWQAHTYEVLNALGETAARLDDAETGQRGYLLTGQDAYLEPYKRAIANLGPVMAHLKEHLHLTMRINRSVSRRLESLVERKLAELQSTIDIYRKAGPVSSGTMVLSKVPENV